MEKNISAEDLKTIQDYKLNVSTHTFQVEKAVLENQIAELQLQNVMLRLYVKYGLDDNYTIDYNSGEIVRKEFELPSKDEMQKLYNEELPKMMAETIESKNKLYTDFGQRMSEMNRATDDALEYELNRNEQD